MVLNSLLSGNFSHFSIQLQLHLTYLKVSIVSGVSGSLCRPARIEESIIIYGARTAMKIQRARHD